MRTILALEWPELVQIGRCRVRWLPSTTNKRNLTSFYSEKTIYTTYRMFQILNVSKSLVVGKPILCLDQLISLVVFYEEV